MTVTISKIRWKVGCSHEPDYAQYYSPRKEAVEAAVSS
jgi:hypothetical protein